MLRSARNLDGMVSRFLASRLCSKVPVKAKAHVRSRSGREVSRSRVAEWEEPRHPGTASQEAKYPTSPHSATQNPHAPHIGSSSCIGARSKWPICGDFAVGRFSCRSAVVLQRRAAAAANCTRDCAFAGRLRPFGGRSGRNWRSACRERRDQRRGHEQQHGGDEQERDHELDLRARPSPPARTGAAARSDRASAAWAASVPPSGAPWRSARLQRGDELRDPGGGAARLESGRARGSAAPPTSARSAARSSSRASRPGWRRPTSVQRPPRREPGGDRHPQQVEHVGQLGLDRLARARERERAARTRARGSRRPARRAGARCRAARARAAAAGSAATPTSSASPACSATISRGRPIEPGGGDARGEPARGVDADARRRAARCPCSSGAGGAGRRLRSSTAR